MLFIFSGGVLLLALVGSKSDASERIKEQV